MSDAAAVKRLGVIGDPVAHSISPAIQQAALDRTGVAATYERWHTPVEELPDRIASLRAPDVLGANVTVPHKQAVVPLLDEVRPVAIRAGAVNTIINQAGRLIGDNTDVHGVQAALANVCPDIGSRSVLILGAGGAARGVVLGLDNLGVSRIRLWNRKTGRVQQLVADLAPLSIDVVDADLVALERAVEKAMVLINATSVGWHGDETPLPVSHLSHLHAGSLVMDLTYRDTALLQAARERGVQTLDGLPMLVYQGARAFELWTGVDAPVAVMFEAARAARER
ncbi:MAG: shikimate dehydrogenase [Thermomicrobiales bacterium]